MSAWSESEVRAIDTTQCSCDLGGVPEAFPHFWEHTVGSDHAPIALRSDWQAQLRRCHDELGFRNGRVRKCVYFGTGLARLSTLAQA